MCRVVIPVQFTSDKRVFDDNSGMILVKMDHALLQIRRGNRDNLGIISHISQLKHML